MTGMKSGAAVLEWNEQTGPGGSKQELGDFIGGRSLFARREIIRFDERGRG